MSSDAREIPTQFDGTPLDKRIPELDGLRGVAAVMVLIWHFVGSLWQPAYVWTIFGRTGVDLFFVLSGFLIIGILIDHRDSPNLFRVFYIRRAARIVPAYALLVIVYWICYSLTGPNSAFNAAPRPIVQFGAQVLFGYNWLMAWADDPVARGFSVTWSVALEEQFYLIAPIALVLTPPQHLRKVIICIGLGSATLRAAFYLLYPKYAYAAYLLPPFRLDCLCAGAFVATLWRDRQIMQHLRTARLDLMLVALACIAPLMAYLTAKDVYFHSLTWGHAYLALLYGLGLLVVLTRGGSWLLARPLQEAGRISYSLYLFHPLFLCLFFLGRREAIAGWSDVGLAVGAAVTTIAFCYLSYFLIEQPIRRFGHRARYASARLVKSEAGESLQPLNARVH